MDAVKFLGIRNRMCRSFDGCRECPAYINAGGCFSSADPERLVRAVEGWATVEDMPTVDVAAVVHGRWIEDECTYPRCRVEEQPVLCVRWGSRNMEKGIRAGAEIAFLPQLRGKDGRRGTCRRVTRSRCGL